MKRLGVLLLLAPLVSAAIVVLGVTTLSLFGSWPIVDWILRRVFALAAWAAAH